MKVKLFNNVAQARQFTERHNKHARTTKYAIVMYGEGLYWVDSYKPKRVVSPEPSGRQ